MTRTELANLALHHLDKGPISSIDDTKPAAQHCRRMWDFVLEGLLRVVDWGCCNSEATLQLSDKTPLFGWKHAYNLPADFNRLTGLNGGRAPITECDLHKGQLLCDLKPTGGLRIHYIRKEQDISKWSPRLREAFALKLALAVAPALNMPPGTMSKLEQHLETVILRARQLPVLTRGAKNVKLAEAHGWTKVQWYEDSAGPGLWWGIPPADFVETSIEERTHGATVPDYFSDLNAVMPLVRKLEGDNRSLHQDWLSMFRSFPPGMSRKELEWFMSWLCVIAEAHEHAEALGRTLRLWEQDQ